jgi:hypothetical protein
MFVAAAPTEKAIPEVSNWDEATCLTDPKRSESVWAHRESHASESRDPSRLGRAHLIGALLRD